MEKLILLVLAITTAVLAEKEADTQVVESIVREVRAAPPLKLKDLIDAGAKFAYVHKYDDGGDGKNEKGYFRKGDDNGNDGYKHFDSYHKKDSDKYGYEAHSAFGKYAHEADEAGEKNAKYKQDDDGGKGEEDAEEDAEEHGEEEGEETRTTYQVVENTDEDDGHYAAGDDDGYYYEGGDSGDDGGASEHYEQGSDDDDDSGEYDAGYAGGNYGSEGDQGHDEGSSAYSHEGDGGESEHYEDYDY